MKKTIFREEPYHVELVSVCLVMLLLIIGTVVISVKMVNTNSAGTVVQWCLGGFFQLMTILIICRYIKYSKPAFDEVLFGDDQIRATRLGKELLTIPWDHIQEYGVVNPLGAQAKPPWRYIYFSTVGLTDLERTSLGCRFYPYGNKSVLYFSCYDKQVKHEKGLDFRELDFMPTIFENWSEIIHSAEEYACVCYNKDSQLNCYTTQQQKLMNKKIRKLEFGWYVGMIAMQALTICCLCAHQIVFYW